MFPEEQAVSRASAMLFLSCPTRLMEELVGLIGQFITELHVMQNCYTLKRKMLVSNVFFVFSIQLKIPTKVPERRFRDSVQFKGIKIQFIKF